MNPFPFHALPPSVARTFWPIKQHRRMEKAAAKAHDESVPLVQVEVERVSFERKIAGLERQHQQVISVPT